MGVGKSATDAISSRPTHPKDEEAGRTHPSRATRVILAKNKISGAFMFKEERPSRFEKYNLVPNGSSWLLQFYDPIALQYHSTASVFLPKELVDIVVDYCQAPFDLPVDISEPFGQSRGPRQAEA